MANKKKNSINILLALGAITGVATAATLSFNKAKNKGKNSVFTKSFEYMDNGDKQVYFIGSGLASLSGAAYLIRDCNFKGENIHIIEGMKVLGGSNDDGGNPITGFICGGERMLNEETYENFWELFSSIPSIEFNGKSVTEEILNFDHLHPTHAQARLIDKNGSIENLESMGLNSGDRAAIGKLIATQEDKLEDLSIEEWFKNTPHFFETNFWYIWQTTFLFQRWSSLLEFKRYIERLILEVSRLETLEGITKTPYNQYESIIMPLKVYLENFNVNFKINTIVTDLKFKEGEEITVNEIHIKENDIEKVIELNDGDICIMTNGCMSDNLTLGDYNTPPEYNIEKPISGQLWTKIARKKIGLGNPETFFKYPEKTNWESFTVTSKGNKLLKLIECFSGNTPGSGGIITFKDSNWLISIVIPNQPYFKNQPLDCTVFWGYGLNTDIEGNYIKKSMRNCTGEEILTELLYHLHFEDKIHNIKENVINVIPCMRPYINSQFQPHKITDRPEVIPEGSTNFAMIGQFVEIPKDIVFTEEYSVRSARIAIYKLFNIKLKKISAITQYKKDPKVLRAALKKIYS